ncbi:alkaline phosphatase family protein [soil metagenome]
MSAQRLEFAAPAYSTSTLGDVVPAVASALGHRLTATSGLVLPPASAYVVMLIDGLGAQLLRRYQHAAPFLASLMDQMPTMTAGVPSTTATSLTSFGTGLAPGQHGLVGYTSRIPGTNRLLNALQWPAEVDPTLWQPNRTAFQDLAALGATVTVINRREYVQSGLTVAAHRGADYLGADRVGERLAGAVAAAVPDSLTYLYDGDLDWTGHRHGVASEAWLQQLSMIDAEAEQLRDMLPSHVRLLVVADHGMIDSPVEDRIDIDDYPALRDGVALIGGEARFRQIYCAAGAVEDVAATWRETVADRAEVWTRTEAIGLGWFGQVAASVLPRIGDVVVAAKGSFAVMSSKDFRHEMSLVGLHGSLTDDEMLIPVLTA